MGRDLFNLQVRIPSFLAGVVVSGLSLLLLVKGQ